jgi:hypothetical protein
MSVSGQAGSPRPTPGREDEFFEQMRERQAAARVHETERVCKWCGEPWDDGKAKANPRHTPENIQPGSIKFRWIRQPRPDDHCPGWGGFVTTCCGRAIPNPPRQRFSTSPNWVLAELPTMARTRESESHAS